MVNWTTGQQHQQQAAANNGLAIVKKSSTPPPSSTQSPDRIRGATHDLFELLERVQSSRLDDQRCVLPAYFSQVRITLFLFFSFYNLSKLIYLLFKN